MDVTFAGASTEAKEEKCWTSSVRFIAPNGKPAWLVSLVHLIAGSLLTLLQPLLLPMCNLLSGPLSIHNLMVQATGWLAPMPA